MRSDLGPRSGVGLRPRGARGADSAAGLGSIRAELREQFPHLLSNIWGVALGLHDAPWLAYYDFFSRIGLDPLSLVAPLMNLARSGAGWWWEFSKVAIVTSAPYLLNRDAENRLHCEHGPALAYPDGWAVWAIHGVRAAERVITAPQTLTSRSRIRAKPGGPSCNAGAIPLLRALYPRS